MCPVQHVEETCLHRPGRRSLPGCQLQQPQQPRILRTQLCCQSTQTLEFLRQLRDLSRLKTIHGSTLGAIRRSDAGPVEALDETGLAPVCLPHCDHAHGELVVAVFALGECLEIGEQLDGGVVLGWFPGVDQRVDA